MPEVLNSISLLTPANPLTGGEFLVVDQQQGAAIGAGSISVGLPYRILDLGNTNWAAVGAGASAAVGTVFIASAVGTGTGTVVRLETRRGTIADVSASTIALISSGGLVLPVLTVEGIATIDEVHGGLTGKVFTQVKNTSGGSLSQLVPCRVAGSVGDTATLQVVAARADNGGLMPAAGILATTLANNGEGHMVIGGVLGGVNTAAWTSGADLFVAPAGGLTATRPAANVQRIATVGRSHASTGSLLVQVGSALAGVAFTGSYGDLSNPPPEITQAAAEAGTSTTFSIWSPQRWRQAAAAWWLSVTSGFGRTLASAPVAADARAALQLGSAAQAATTDFVSATTAQLPNVFLAGPASGASASPAFRAIANADLPPNPGFTSVTFPSGQILNNDTRYSATYRELHVDSNGRLAWGVLNSGVVQIPRILGTSATIQSLAVQTLTVGGSPISGDLGAVETSAGELFSLETVSGQRNIVRYNPNRTVLVTGDNYGLFLTADAPPRIGFIGNARLGTPTLSVMKADGTEVALAIPLRNIVIFGDSFTALMAPNNYLATKLGDGRNVEYRGVGGQTSVQIAGRQGGLAVTGTIAGSQIPASGAVGVSGLYPSVVTSQGGDTTYLVQGTTIRGVLSWNGGNPTFTRSTSGSVTAVTNPVTFVPVNEVTFNNIVYHRNELTSIWWLGRNGVGGSFGETDVSIYTAMFTKMRNIVPRVLILSIFNGENEGTGTTNYTNIIARNTAIQAAFPSNYYDLRTEFVLSCKAWLQTNYSAYFASSWGTGDTDVAADIPPAALRSDGLHLNDYGMEYAAQLIAAQIIQRGW